MVIVEIDRNPVTDLAAAHQLLRPGRHLLFVYDHGAQAFVAIVVHADRP